MDIDWLGFGKTVGIGFPVFAFGCYLWRSSLASSPVRIFILSFILAAPVTPFFAAPCGNVGVGPAVLAIKNALFVPDTYGQYGWSDPSAVFFLLIYVFFPMFILAVLVYAIWAVILYLFTLLSRLKAQ